MTLWNAYLAAKDLVINDRNELEQVGVDISRVVMTRLDEVSAHLPGRLDSRAGEVRLLHGTNPNHVLPSLRRGLTNRAAVRGCAFGSGIYLSEDPEKCDQYTAPVGDDAFMRDFRSHLPSSEDVDMRGYCFCFVVRALCGHAMRIQGLEPGQQRDLAGRDVFRSQKRIDLAQISGTRAANPVHYHSLIVEKGKALRRFREFISFHEQRVYVEYVLAYQRV